MEMITKYFRAEVRSIDEEKHTALVTISDQTVDNYRDIIDVNGWKKHLVRFNQRPVLLSSHNYGDLRKQIGTSEKVFVKDDALHALLKYFVGAGNDEADWAWYLVSKKVAAYSVGFKPKAMRYWNEMTEDEQKEARKKYKIPPKVTPFRIFLEQELMENSQVTMPANTNAVQDGLKDKDCVVRKTAEDISAITKAKVEADLKSSDPDIKREAEEYLDEIESKLWEDEEGWKEIRYRVKDPDLFVRIRRKKMPGVTPPIVMLVGPLKSDPTGGAKIQSLRFPKPAWTLAKAKAWVKAHPDVKKALHDENATGCMVDDEVKSFDDLEDAPEEQKVDDKPNVICQGCKKEFDYLKEPEVAMGWVKCPGCGKTVDQTGKVLVEPKPPVKESVPKPEEPKSLSDEDREAINQLTNKVSELIEKIGGAGGKSGDKPGDNAEDQDLYAEILSSGKDTLGKLNPKK